MASYTGQGDDGNGGDNFLSQLDGLLRDVSAMEGHTASAPSGISLLDELPAPPPDTYAKYDPLGIMNTPAQPGEAESVRLQRENIEIRARVEQHAIEARRQQQQRQQQQQQQRQQQQQQQQGQQRYDGYGSRRGYYEQEADEQRHAQRSWPHDAAAEYAPQRPPGPAVPLQRHDSAASTGAQDHPRTSGNSSPVLRRPISLPAQYRGAEESAYTARVNSTDARTRPLAARYEDRTRCASQQHSLASSPHATATSRAVPPDQAQRQMSHRRQQQQSQHGPLRDPRRQTEAQPTRDANAVAAVVAGSANVRDSSQPEKRSFMSRLMPWRANSDIAAAGTIPNAKTKQRRVTPLVILVVVLLAAAVVAALVIVVLNKKRRSAGKAPLALGQLLRAPWSAKHKKSTASDTDVLPVPTLDPLTTESPESGTKRDTGPAAARDVTRFALPGASVASNLTDIAPLTTFAPSMRTTPAPHSQSIPQPTRQPRYEPRLTTGAARPMPEHLGARMQGMPHPNFTSGADLLALARERIVGVDTHARETRTPIESPGPTELTTEAPRVRGASDLATETRASRPSHADPATLPQQPTSHGQQRQQHLQLPHAIEFHARPAPRQSAPVDLQTVLRGVSAPIWPKVIAAPQSLTGDINPRAHPRGDRSSLVERDHSERQHEHKMSLMECDGGVCRPPRRISQHHAEIASDVRYAREPPDYNDDDDDNAIRRNDDQPRHSDDDDNNNNNGGRLHATRSPDYTASVQQHPAQAVHQRPVIRRDGDANDNGERDSVGYGNENEGGVGDGGNQNDQADQDGLAAVPGRAFPERELQRAPWFGSPESLVPRRDRVPGGRNQISTHHAQLPARWEAAGVTITDYEEDRQHQEPTQVNGSSNLHELEASSF